MIDNDKTRFAFLKDDFPEFFEAALVKEELAALVKEELMTPLTPHEVWTLACDAADAEYERDCAAAYAECLRIQTAVYATWMLARDAANAVYALANAPEYLEEKENL